MAFVKARRVLRIRRERCEIGQGVGACARWNESGCELFAGAGDVWEAVRRRFLGHPEGVVSRPRPLLVTTTQPAVQFERAMGLEGGIEHRAERHAYARRTRSKAVGRSPGVVSVWSRNEA